VAAPSLEAFKARLDRALSKLVKAWEGVPAYGRGRVELDNLQGAFQPKPFYDCMIVRLYDYMIL